MPSPDDRFDWSGIPKDIHGAVAKCLALTDARSDELLDQECRTAFRSALLTCWCRWNEDH